jgi:hypothetical protein
VRDAQKALGTWWGIQRAIDPDNTYEGGKIRKGPGGGVVALVPVQAVRITQILHAYIEELRDEVRHDTTRHDTTRHDTTRHDTTRHDTTRHVTYIYIYIIYIFYSSSLSRSSTSAARTRRRGERDTRVSSRPFRTPFGSTSPSSWAAARSTILTTF